MSEMNKKDALTDLIDVAQSQPDDRPSNNGSVSTPSGEQVNLGFELRLQELAHKLLKIVRHKHKLEQEVLEQIVKKGQK